MHKKSNTASKSIWPHCARKSSEPDSCAANVHYRHKKGGTKVFTNGKSRLSRFLSKFGPKLLSDFYDMTVNRQFSSKRWTKKRARFLVQLSKEKCPNMQTGCFQLPLLGSASSLVIYRTTSRIHLRLLQFIGGELVFEGAFLFWCNCDFTRNFWNNPNKIENADE